MMKLLLDVLPVEPEMEEVGASGGHATVLIVLLLAVVALFIAVYLKKKNAAGKPEEIAGSDAVEATEAKESDEKTEN